MWKIENICQLSMTKKNILIRHLLLRKGAVFLLFKCNIEEVIIFLQLLWPENISVPENYRDLEISLFLKSCKTVTMTNKYILEKS